MTPYDIAEKNGISEQALNARLARGWTLDRSIKAPINKGRSKWLKIALENGIKKSTFDYRYYSLFWSFEDAATVPVSQKPPSERQRWLKVAKENGISLGTFNSRVNMYGRSYEYAATHPVQKQRKKEIS
ncbi:hypothetical protein J2Z83_003758 [Virgibacillus natechei]|uniref:DNA-binding protein n=1 Tax=Virgibacillus natechei TaxID=1216297 RepID=A0ABS4IKY0_9BACI|nr:hypothetical protein [Virgibacillus natechei]MBP1971607.1 hypothetical protein [Virgibacillus natechei]UZD13063.1 hypothetical protein OLD84_00340 [Virgibacillus natechei]